MSQQDDPTSHLIRRAWHDETLAGVTGGASFVVPHIPLTPRPSSQPTGGPLDELARRLHEAAQPGRPDALL